MPSKDIKITMPPTAETLWSLCVNVPEEIQSQLVQIHLTAQAKYDNLLKQSMKANNRNEVRNGGIASQILLEKYPTRANNFGQEFGLLPANSANHKVTKMRNNIQNHSTVKCATDCYTNNMFQILNSDDQRTHGKNDISTVSLHHTTNSV